MKIPAIHEPYDSTSHEFELYIESLKHLSEAELDMKVIAAKKLALKTNEHIADYIALGTAALILKSRRAGDAIENYLAAEDTQVTVFVIQPIFNEADRMSPRSESNPHGENALLYRVGRFVALHTANPRINFHLIVVDDGCDGGGDVERKSSHVAQRLLEQASGSGITTEVILLDDLIRDAGKYGWNPGIESAADSVKGGSIIGGFAYARSLSAKDTSDEHIFVDIDADLSIHPDQTLLLIEAILIGSNDAAVASRRAEGAVAWIDHHRDLRGQEYIRAWQSLLPELAKYVVDINRGMKAFSSDVIDMIIDEVKERTFVYQVESLNLLAIHGRKIAEVPISYVDSVALSTQAGDTPVQSYDDQMERIRRLAGRARIQ